MDRTAKNPGALGPNIVQVGVIGLIIFSPLPAASVHGWSILVIQLAALGLTAVFLLTGGRESQDLQRGSPLKAVKYFFFGFWIFVLFQCLPLPKFLVGALSPGTRAFLEQYRPDYSSLKFFSFSLSPSISLQSALALLPYFLIGFLIVKAIKKRSQVVRLFYVLFLMGVFEAIYGLFGLFSKSRFVSGTFINRNHFAGYLEMMIPVGLGLLLAREGRGKKAFVSSLVISSGVIVMSLALLFSRSRSGAVILVIVFVLFLFLFPKKILLVVVVILIIVLSVYVGMDSTLQRFSWDYLQKDSRIGIWNQAWDVFTDYPFFGSGLGTFGVMYSATEADGETFTVAHAHNDYLEFLSELGIIGMGLLLGGMVLFLVACSRKWREQGNPSMRGFCFGGFVSVLALSLHGLTDFNLQIPSNILLFSVVLSLTYAAVSVKHPD
jgi:O-antigen ligase